MHLHSDHSDLGTQRTELVLDVMQYIPAAGTHNHSCLMRRSCSRVLSSVFKSPDLCHQSKRHDICAGVFFFHGRSRNKHGMLCMLMRCIEIDTDITYYQFQVYTIQPVWSSVWGWSVVRNMTNSTLKTQVMSTVQKTNITKILLHTAGVSTPCSNRELRS